MEKEYATKISLSNLEEVVDTKATKTDLETTQYRLTKQETACSSHREQMWEKIDEMIK